MYVRIAGLNSQTYTKHKIVVVTILLFLAFPPMVFFKTMYSIIELLFLSYLPVFVAWFSIRFPVSDLFAHELPQARRVQSIISNPIHRNCILYRFQILCLASVGRRLRLHFLLAFHPYAGLLCIVANFAPRGHGPESLAEFTRPEP